MASGVVVWVLNDYNAIIVPFAFAAVLAAGTNTVNPS
jgi:hypothetical protein